MHDVMLYTVVGLDEDVLLATLCLPVVPAVGDELVLNLPGVVVAVPITTEVPIRVSGVVARRRLYTDVASSGSPIFRVYLKSARVSSIPVDEWWSMGWKAVNEAAIKDSR